MDVLLLSEEACSRLFRAVRWRSGVRCPRRSSVRVRGHGNYGPQALYAEIEKIPHELLQKWNMPKDQKTIKLALNSSYELLNSLGDPLGQCCQNDKKLKDLLSKRNMPILAHGKTPITRQVYVQLRKRTLEYAEALIKNLGQLIENSKFIKWKQ